MVHNVDESAADVSIVAVDIGNTHTAIGRWQDGAVDEVLRVASSDADAVHAALDVVRGKCANRTRQAIVIAPVVPAVSAELTDHIESVLDLRAFVVGDNVPLPLETGLADPTTVGADRICAAAAAFDRTGHACAIIDIGSAVTVDLVDDDGIFQGGAILPGPHLQARALADHTARLPHVEVAAPATALGKDTVEAINSGLVFGLLGAIRGLVEQIAAERNAWPQVIVTGGGADLLRDQLDFVDNWVPDLCLIGAGLAYRRRAAQMFDA